jgi:3-oxoacyl-[acyl-carrier protein] reductase
MPTQGAASRASHAGLTGQVALVTGGGKGIGRAIALELAARGAAVLVTGREERTLGETVGEIAYGGGRARHRVADVRVEADADASVAAAIEAWGRLDIVVANAGITATTLIDDPASRATARAVVETNLLGTFFTFSAAVPVLRSPGRLVAISSVLGKLGAPGQGAYCASKAGVQGLIHALALELGPRQITCNAVCPGWVDTDMARGRIGELARESGGTPEEARAQAARAVPIRRFVESEEVAALVAHLCSPAGSAITGQALSVCGGATAFGA